MYMKPNKKVTHNKIKRRAKRWMFTVFIVFFIILSLTGVGLYAMKKLPHQRYISPLPSVQAYTMPSPDDKTLSSLKKGLTDKNFQYTSITAKDGNYIIKMADGAEVTFDGKKDIMWQISSLQYIVQHLTMEGKLFSRLDLRFEKPVIVLKKI
jgi:hypothetical protein